MLEGNKLYTKVQSLKDDFVKISNLDLDYFEKLFVYLFVWYLLLSVCPALVVCLKLFLRKMQLLKMIIQEYQTRFQLKLTFRLPVCKLIKLNKLVFN